jgi:2-amino-4-hydroxy-6-hydroxymethyldihydropteridine diphosphokinase
MFGSREQDDPKLILPHQRLTERRFVLEPLLEIDAAATLPDGTPLAEMLERLGDDQVTWPVADL